MCGLSPPHPCQFYPLKISVFGLQLHGERGLSSLTPHHAGPLALSPDSAHSDYPAFQLRVSWDQWVPSEKYPFYCQLNPINSCSLLPIIFFNLKF